MRSRSLACACAFLLFIAPAVSRAQDRFFMRLAGIPGSTRPIDGPVADARFASPRALVCDDPTGLYLVDGDYAATSIRRIADGEVTTVAGPSRDGSPTFHDGRGGRADFSWAFHMTGDGSRLWVLDSYDIRSVSHDGVVTTMLESPLASSYVPTGLARGADGVFFVANPVQKVVWKLAPGATIFAGTLDTMGVDDGPGATAKFYIPKALSLDPSGNLWIHDAGTVRVIAPDGTVAHVAGQFDQTGSADGIAFDVRFSNIIELSAAPDGSVYVADLDNGIRRVTRAREVTTPVRLPFGVGVTGVCVDRSGTVFAATGKNGGLEAAVVKFANGVVMPIAGTYGLQDPSRPTTPRDGIGDAARFSSPRGLALDTALNAYTLDSAGIRKITPDGVVTTVGPPLDDARDLAIAPDGTIYVAASGGVYRIGTDRVPVLIAGSSREYGAIDGPGLAARFRGIASIARASDGSLYVADYGSSTIRKIGSDGNVTTYAGQLNVSGTEDGTGAVARFSAPVGVAVNSQGNLFVMDQEPFPGRLRKIAPGGVVTTIKEHRGVSVAPDASGGLYIADTGTIYYLSPSGADAMIGGSGLFSGNDEGVGTNARFSGISKILLTPDGRLVFVDQTNEALFVSLNKLPDTAAADRLDPLPGTAVSLRVNGQTASLFQWREIRKPAASRASLSATNVANPTFTPDVPDIYTFELRARSATGANISTVTIAAAEPPPVAAFAVPSPTPKGVALQFRDASAGWPNAWAWNFGDGGTSIDYAPLHKYAAEGTYTVTLRVTNGAGSSTTSRTLTITAAPKRRAISR